MNSKKQFTSIRKTTSYSNNYTPAPRQGSRADLRAATSHVLRSNNPRTQATGVAIGAFTAITAVAGIACMALDVIGGRRY